MDFCFSCFQASSGRAFGRLRGRAKVAALRRISLFRNFEGFPAGNAGSGDLSRSGSKSETAASAV